MGFKDSRLRGKIDGMKKMLSLIKPENRDSAEAIKLKQAIAETEEELKRLTDSR